MVKYYTRACNFYYGTHAKILIKKRKALPLCGNKQICFDSVEIFIRKNKKISSKIVSLSNLKNLNKTQVKKVKKDLKKITSKRKKFSQTCGFFKTINYGYFKYDS